MKGAHVGLILLLGLGSAPPFAAETASTGRLCLTAAPTPTPGPKSLANATGGLPDVTYFVQVDGGPPIELSRSAGRWVSGLETEESHLVVIRAGAKRTASFRFRFATDEPAELCLFLNPLYETWQVWPDDRCPWCKCEGD